MVEQPAPETIQRLGRWFAVDCNNAAWELSERATRTEAEDRELLLRAYAAAFHWSKVGTPLHVARAEVLLSHVHGLLGHAPLAASWARRAVAFFEAGNGEDWDLAFAYGVLAQAARVAGDATADALRAQAERQGGAIAKSDDRDVFQAFFERTFGRASG